jgi:ABC-type nitrate/sulfonate/bicarbonate transport system substrate-binding protein
MIPFGRKAQLLGLAVQVFLLACGHRGPEAGAPGPDSGTAVDGSPGGAPSATVRVRSASRSLPMLAAIANGFFEAENLSVDYTQFESSRPTFVQVSKQEIEVIISSTDNAINYQVNPNNPAGGILDVQIIFAHDNGLGLALVALPEFATAESLRGKRIAVDVPGSGFALPVAKIMREHGMEAGADYMMESAGGSPARLAGLLEKPPKWEAAIINAESVVRARELGLSVIGAVSDVVSPYLGGAGASSRKWLRGKPDVAERFIRGFYRGTMWLRDPANREAAIQLLVDVETPPELATKVYELNIAPDGLTEAALVDRAALRKVLALRDEFMGFETPQNLDFLASPDGGLYDLTFYTRATRDLEARSHR